VLNKLAQGVFRIGVGIERDAAAIAALMQRYADLPMSLADACRCVWRGLPIRGLMLRFPRL
jgi:hypothetical protein